MTMLVMVTWTASSYAQIPIPNAMVVTSTPPFDPTNDFGITSYSLTASGGGGNWAAYNGPSIGGITAQDIGPGALFQGLVKCKPDCATTYQLILQADFNTFQSALSAADAASAVINPTTLANIQTDAGLEVNLLPLMRDQLDATLNELNAIEQLTQAVDALVKVEVAAHVTELNAQAQTRANTVDTWDPNVPSPW